MKHRIWKPVNFESRWENCDTSILDDILPSWKERRGALQQNSSEYAEFLAQLKREHAIETGVIERLYELSRGITQTLIEQGFSEALFSHGDSNLSPQSVLRYLRDHEEAIDWIFDMVKDERPLSTSFIKSLHQLVTQNQKDTDAIDSLGNETKTALLKGEYKQRENNPQRDGNIYLYCPPEQVAVEMDNLIVIYHELCARQLNPLIISAWLHHAFTTIHPFQDGNGRLARLLASLVLVRHNLFPLNVLREEAKSKYIAALEKADEGDPQPLVSFFAEVQQRYIQKALNIREVSASSFEEVQDVFARLLDKIGQEEKASTTSLAQRRQAIFQTCSSMLEPLKNSIERRMAGRMSISLAPFGFDSSATDLSGHLFRDFYQAQIISYARTNQYYFNRNLPKAYFKVVLSLPDRRMYHLIISLHHMGYGDDSLVLCAFLINKWEKETDQMEATTLIPLKPYTFSIASDALPAERNVRQHIEQIMTLALAQIANEL